MICSKCKNQGILNSAGGKEFYYCRTCKEEIGLEDAATTTFELDNWTWPTEHRDNFHLTQDEVDALVREWQRQDSDKDGS